MLDENKVKAQKSYCSPNDLLMKPFALGWTREVVNRVVAKNRNLNCDIYYFSPSGKKIRSLTEIKSNLSDGLTPECFSFKRQPLGINKDYETVRDARVKRKKSEVLNDAKSEKCIKRTNALINEGNTDLARSKRRKLMSSTCGIKNKASAMKNTKLKTVASKNKVKEKMKKKTAPKKVSQQPKQNIRLKNKMKTKPEEQTKIKSTSRSSTKTLITPMQAKVVGNKQHTKKIIGRKANVSKKSKLSGEKIDKETGIKAKVTTLPRNIKNLHSKNNVKENIKNSDIEMEGKMDKKSPIKDLRSIVKKNIGKYREMREKQKLAVKSQVKMKRSKIPLSGITRTRSEPISKNKQLYLKPFEKGWRRELVFRKNCAKAGQHADVYYFHPSGKKLRSCREIAENLTQGLTIEYFTFRKEPIGCGEPSEIIREARSHSK